MIIRTGSDRREEEWKQIRKDMEAGSGATGVNVSTVFKPEASILQELRKELRSQEESLAEFEKQDWDDQGEDLTRGWCEALEFAIKLIDNKGSKADQ